MLKIKNNIFIDEAQLSYQATRSSGPGGQHVNKVSSRVILSCPLQAIQGLSEKQVGLVKNGLARFIVSGDIIKLDSQKHRSQFANKQDCTDKLIQHLQIALKEAKPRKKTKVPKGVKEKRLQEKSKRAKLKQDRRFKDE